MNVDKVWFESRMRDKGLSQNDVTRVMGLHQGALSRMLNGKRNMKPSEIHSLAAILTVPDAAVLEHLNTAASATPPAGGLGEMKQKDFTSQAPKKDAAAAVAKVRHPAWGALKGTTIVMPGVNLTEPTAPEWGQLDD